MKTLRIYYNAECKAPGLTFWQKVWDSSYSTCLIKKAKEYDIAQVICFNIPKGYLDNQSIQWGMSEVKNVKHPQCVELVDSEEKIRMFLECEKELLSQAKTVLVSSESEQIFQTITKETSNRT